jgi:hypothetical protein
LPKLITVDEHTNYEVVHQLTLGKANGFSCQTLDSCSQAQMFTLNLLCLLFAYLMHFNWEMSFIGSPAIGAKPLDAKWFKQLLELKKHLKVEA